MAGKKKKNKISNIWKNVDKNVLPYSRVIGLSIFWILYETFKSSLDGFSSYLATADEKADTLSHQTEIYIRYTESDAL